MKKIVQDKGNSKRAAELVVETLRELQEYLSSSIFHQVGPKSSKKIVSTFGVRTIGVIEKSAHELHKVDGIGRRRVASIIDGWTAQRRLKKTCLILLREGGDYEKRNCE